MAQKAEVKYDPAYITPLQIANHVMAIGYEALVLENEVHGQNTVEVHVSIMWCNLVLHVQRIFANKFDCTISWRKSYIQLFIIASDCCRNSFVKCDVFCHGMFVDCKSSVAVLCYLLWAYCSILFQLCLCMILHGLSVYFVGNMLLSWSFLSLSNIQIPLSQMFMMLSGFSLVTLFCCSLAVDWGHDMFIMCSYDWINIAQEGRNSWSFCGSCNITWQIYLRQRDYGNQGHLRGYWS